MSITFKNIALKNISIPNPNPPLPMSDMSFIYSLRRINPDYTGDAIRVRRTTPDSTEQDIGFDANGDLDEVALLTFCGAGDGFVTIWYEQNQVSDFSISQTTTSQQPQIVDSGAVIKVNGRPSLAWSNANTTVLERASVSLTELINNEIGCAFFVLYQTVQTSSFVFMHEPGSTSSRYSISYPWDSSSIYWDAGSYFISRLTISGFSTITDQLIQGSCFRAGADMSVYANSSVLGTKSDATGTPAWGSRTLYVGSNNSLSLDGYLSEIIFSNKELLGKRLLIETNQQDYYNIT